MSCGIVDEDKVRSIPIREDVPWKSLDEVRLVGKRHGDRLRPGRGGQGGLSRPEGLLAGRARRPPRDGDRGEREQGTGNEASRAIERSTVGTEP